MWYLIKVIKNFFADFFGDTVYDLGLYYSARILDVASY
jgi:hypothetical protein